MNERARLRVLRNFVASILASNLSKADIAAVAEDLAYGRMGRELAQMLRDILIVLPDLPPREQYVQRVVEAEPLHAALAYDMAQRKKVTKKGLIQAMGTAAPRLVKDDIPSGTMRDLLEWFFDVATAQQKSKLLSLLSDAEPDQYLKGITGRS